MYFGAYARSPPDQPEGEAGLGRKILELEGAGRPRKDLGEFFRASRIAKFSCASAVAPLSLEDITFSFLSFFIFAL